MSTKLVQIKEKTYRFNFEDFEEDVDIDDLLKIDYNNLIGEMITFPVIVNRFGTLLAEAESRVAEMKLNLEVLEAKTKEKIRTEIIEQNGKSPTVEALNNAVLMNTAYQAMKKKLIDVQKTRDYINSAFWAAKDKSNKIDRLSLTVTNDDVPDSVIEGRVNSVLLKKVKKTIE
jgi:hypothetical protein